MVQISYMQRGLILGTMALLITVSSGCANTESVSSNMNDSVVSESNCETLNYGIREFNLISSMPTLSGSYDLSVTVEQTGDCKAKELTVSIFDNDSLVTQHKVFDPGLITPQLIHWSPKRDGEIHLSVVLEIMDDNLKDNVESILVFVNPLGNYLRINDLTSEVFNSANRRAELLTSPTPIHISTIEAFLQKADADADDGTLVVQIFADENGTPGKILKQIEQNVTLHNQFDWHKIPVDLSIDAGKYWVVMTTKDNKNVMWHYSRKPAGGPQRLSDDPVYESNSSSMALIDNEWSLLPEKDFSFKVHAGGSNE